MRVGERSAGRSLLCWDEGKLSVVSSKIVGWRRVEIVMTTGALSATIRLFEVQDFRARPPLERDLVRQTCRIKQKEKKDVLILCRDPFHNVVRRL